MSPAHDTSISSQALVFALGVTNSEFPNDKARKGKTASALRHSSFVIPSSFVLTHSSFSPVFA
jgi:hypothetical protein